MPTSKQIDLTGIRCPMPIVELNRCLREMEEGDELVATADDPAFCPDVEAWCRRTGHKLVDIDRSEGQCVVVIRKKS